MRGLLLVVLLASASTASAQIARSTDADRAGIGVFTGAVAAFATWVTTTPWGGFWRDSPEPLDWRAWSSALAVGVVAGLVAALSVPDTHQSVVDQAATLGYALALEVPVLLVRGLVSLGADPCNEICHKLAVGLPLLLGLAASIFVGQASRALSGPPTMTMVAPLTIQF